MILQRDIRTPPLQSERRLQGHRQEVCGLKWSTDHQLLASGGNDNKVGTPTPHWPGLSLSLPPGQPSLRAGVERVHPQGTPSEDRDGGRRHPGLTATAPQLLVWNHSSLSPVQQYTEHLAAVKAIAWSPHQHGLLASGGGTADRCIRFWNTLTGQPLQCIDTGSQVCNLAWSKHANELVSVGPQPGGTRPGARPGAAGGQSTSPGPVTASPGVLGEARPLPPGLRGPGLSQPAAPSPSSHHRVQGEGLSPWSAPRGRPVVLVPRGVLGPGPREEPQGPWRRLPTGEHARLLAEPDPGLEVPVSDAGGQADRPLLPGPLLGESAGPGAGGQPLQRRGLDPTARRLVPSGIQWWHRFGPPGPDSPPALWGRAAVPPRVSTWVFIFTRVCTCTQPLPEVPRANGCGCLWTVQSRLHEAGEGARLPAMLLLPFSVSYQKEMFCAASGLSLAQRHRAGRSSWR